MSDLVVYVGAVGLALIASLTARRRVAGGDRRWAGVVMAPAVVLVLLPMLTMTGDLKSLGWLALPGLAVEVVVLVVAAWLVIEVTLAGIESKTEAEFDARTENAMVGWALSFNGLVLICAGLALIGLLIVGVTLALRG